MIEYQTHTLDNGLKIIIHEDHAVPKAVVDVVYRVGSKDEEAHRTGFAHLFEHLMFEGSKHIPSYDEPLQRVGGENNAFTNFDITNYYLSVPANQLETAFWLESDRMLELSFSEEKLKTQKDVVIQEFNQRYLNQPYGDARLKLLGIHFQAHPYRWPVIGKEPAHIAEATLEEVRDFFFGYYAPNNATLVVAGDVQPAQVLDLAQKWFGDIPRRPLKKRALPQEPPQTEARSLTVHGDVPLKAVYKMYHVPAHTERGYYLADILTDLLANGKSGRLYQHMMEQERLASQVNAYSWGMHDPGIISIDAQLSEGVAVATYEAALQQVLDGLQEVTEQELSRIKNKLEATFVMQTTTILSKAMSLAICDSLGDPNLVNTTPALYQSIQLEEVKEAATAFLAPHNGSTLYYLPESTQEHA